MSGLVGIMILGNRNEPLYSCENAAAPPTLDEIKAEDESFGFCDDKWLKEPGHSKLNIRDEVR